MVKVITEARCVCGLFSIYISPVRRSEKWRVCIHTFCPVYMWLLLSVDLLSEHQVSDKKTSRSLFFRKVQYAALER